jgi:hypothetical protein
MSTPSKSTELDQLKQRVVDLEKELRLKEAYRMNLEATISEITPLRRHFKRQLKVRLRSFDGRMISKLQAGRAYHPAGVGQQDDLLEAARQADQINFTNYNHSTKRTIGLSFYLSIRHLGIEVVSRLLRLRQV